MLSKRERITTVGSQAEEPCEYPQSNEIFSLFRETGGSADTRQ